MVCDVCARRYDTEKEGDRPLRADDPLVGFFWETLTRFTPEQKKQFLVFTMARSRLPRMGSSFTFKLRSTPPPKSATYTYVADERLPRTSTCILWLDLPRYSSQAVLEQKLLYAMYHVTNMDADRVVAEEQMLAVYG
jgi:hypothetical protein